MRVFWCLFLLFTFTLPAHANIRFLTLSDLHYGANNSTGDGLDTGDVLLNVTLTKLSQLINPIDFVITLGDFPSHSLGFDSQKEGNERRVFLGLYQADKLAKPMFYVSGNNDSLQGNYQPFQAHSKSPITLTSEWNSACIHCDGLIIDKTHMYDSGYYSSYVIPGNKDIILVALNSIQFAKLAWFQPKYPNQDRDAQIQLQWLKTQLKSHHAKQLLIAMHIPPGTNMNDKQLWQEQYLSQFIALLKLTASQYDQITLLTAHTHMDDIRKIRLDQTKNIYAFATPAVSRIHHNYPGMKIFDLDKQMKIKNYTTFYTTIDNQWTDEQYQALGDKASVFPQCQELSDLVTCLDSLTDTSVCKRLQDGLFYGVKNPRVDSTVCRLTYPVNYH